MCICDEWENASVCACQRWFEWYCGSIDIFRHHYCLIVGFGSILVGNSIHICIMYMNVVYCNRLLTVFGTFVGRFDLDVGLQSVSLSKSQQSQNKKYWQTKNKNTREIDFHAVSLNQYKKDLLIVLILIQFLLLLMLLFLSFEVYLWRLVRDLKSTAKRFQFDELMNDVKVVKRKTKTIRKIWRRINRSVQTTERFGKLYAIIKQCEWPEINCKNREKYLHSHSHRNNNK